jgi:hypothetical protein
LLLSEGQTGEAWERSKKQCSFGNEEHSAENNFAFAMLPDADISFRCRELGLNPTLTVSRGDSSVLTISGRGDLVRQGLLITYPSILGAFEKLRKVT